MRVLHVAPKKRNTQSQKGSDVAYFSFAPYLFLIIRGGMSVNVFNSKTANFFSAPIANSCSAQKTLHPRSLSPYRLHTLPL